jgi:hypothetical protein
MTAMPAIRPREMGDVSAEAYHPARVARAMVPRTILMLALVTIVGVPAAAADDGATLSLPVVEVEVEVTLPIDGTVSESATILTVIPLGDDCIGGWTGSDYVDFYDAPGGGVGVFVGAPIGPLPLAIDVEVDNGFATVSGEWVGVGVKAFGNGCEADQLRA